MKQTMTDFHSHILPKLDDGSRSVAESLALLDALSAQGVSRVVATPHFYADSTDVKGFLKSRAESHQALISEVNGTHPKILLGAELRYYEGVSRLDGINSLCVENSKLLLLEMPVSRWTEYTVNELMYMASLGKYKLVIAHIERYFDFQNQAVWSKLRESGVLFQINAHHFASLGTRRNAIKLVKNGYFHFLGSDCHDIKHRPPLMADACKYIEKKLGAGFLDELVRFGNEALGDQ